MRELRIMACFICLKAKWAFKRRIKKYGDSVEILLTNRLRNALTFATVATEKHVHDIAKCYIYDFLYNLRYVLYGRRHVIHVYKQLIYIQTKFKNHKFIIDGKVEVLVNFWDKMVGEMMNKCSKMRERSTMAVISKIMLVPKHVREYILNFFVKKCYYLYSIGFFNWRLNFPKESDYRNESELQEIIEQREKLFEITGNYIDI